MQRIVVVGTSGSGKSTLAACLADRLNLKLVEPDALFWTANWQQVERSTFRARVTEAIEADRWVFPGNYSSARDLVWARADTLVWLDYSFTLIFWRLLRRSVQRIRTQENLWDTGNTESWRKQFFSIDSLFVWIVKSYGRHKREVPQLLKQPEYAHLRLLRFASPRDTFRWLDTLPKY